MSNIYVNWLDIMDVFFYFPGSRAGGRVGVRGLCDLVLYICTPIWQMHFPHFNIVTCVSYFFTLQSNWCMLNDAFKLYCYSGLMHVMVLSYSPYMFLPKWHISC